MKTITKARAIESFIKKSVKESKSKGAVIGLSGGIDSALTATLAVRSLGKRNVIGIIMHERGVNNPTDKKDAQLLAKKLGIRCKIHYISPILKSFKNPANKNKITRANAKARIRMTILYSYANSLNYMVLGTGNKSELLLGYFTKYGDGGVDILPIADIYKTEVWEMSRILGIPSQIIEKSPSAGLWKGQTDEKELGMSYIKTDSILYLFSEKRYSALKISKKLKISKSRVSRILKKIKIGEHKRTMPKICKTG